MAVGEGLITKPTRLVAITSASSTLGTVTDLRAVTKLAHEVGGLVVVDHTAAAPYRLIDIDEIDADVVALNTIAWGGPPIGALVFRDPAVIDSFTSVAVNPRPGERLEVGVHQFGMLAGVVASIEYLASLDESASGSRRGKTRRVNAIGHVVHEPVVRLFVDVVAVAAAGHGDRPARSSDPGAEFRGKGRAGRTRDAAAGRQRILAISNANSRVLDVIGVNDIGGAVTVGLAHYTTTAEVDQLVRALASLG